MNPQTSSSDRPRLVVIGGGITGLAAAHRALEIDPHIRLLLVEASDRLGGVLRTERHNGFLIEASADNFITRPPWALELARRIGMADEIISTNPAQRGASVVCRGKLYPVPEGFLLMSPTQVWPVLTTPVLSARGKLRLMAEPLVPRRRRPDDESLAAFSRRRLGREAYERLVQPLISGIYTADPEKLSMQAALPRFVHMERQSGSLWWAARREARQRRAAAAESSGARYELFAAPAQGMSRLVEQLAARIPSKAIRLQTEALAVAPAPQGGWRVKMRPVDAAASTHDARRETIEAEQVIVAAPAPHAARLLKPTDRELAQLLEQIPYAGCAVVVLAYHRHQLGRPPQEFGIVVPEVEGRPVLAISFSSEKYPGRAPAEHVLIRVFLGGACHPEVLGWDDQQLLATAQRELSALLRIEGDPLLQRVFRWQGRMPQYHVGHVQRVARIEELVARMAGLELAGNAYHGVGVPNCIHSGEAAAERLLAASTSPTNATPDA